MHRLRKSALRILNIFRKGRLEQDFREQFESHREHLEDEFTRDGMEPSQARSAARRAIGNEVLIRQLTREQHFSQAIETFLSDFRLAVRRLIQRPGTTLVSISALACGIGAAGATWSLLSAVLLNPLPVEDPDRLFVLGWQIGSGSGGSESNNGHSYPTYPAVRETGVFESLAAGGDWPVLIGADRPLQGVAYFASHDFFEVLGVRLAMGREFVPEDDQRGASPVAILSDSYWRLSFGADPEILGKQVVVSGLPAVIVGVAPRGFRGLNLAEAPDMYLPLHTVEDVVGRGDPFTNFFADDPGDIVVSSPTAWVRLFGRLPVDRSPDQAVTRFNSLLSQRPGLTGETYLLTSADTAAIPEVARAGMEQFSRLLALTVGMLLLIGCLAVGVLLLVRTESRRDEFAMCLALGASGGRLARSVIVEGALLAVGGALLALPVASWAFAGIRAFELPGNVQVSLLELSLDTPVLFAIAGGAIAATLLIALVAGSFVFSVNVADSFRSRAGATPRLARSYTRTVLVVGQVAVALVLLTGTGLFARSIAAALNLNPGYYTSRIVTGGVGLTRYGYTREQAQPFFDALRSRLVANPAIASVSMAVSNGGMTPRGQLLVDGVGRQFPSTVTYTGVDEQYFSTVGLPIIEGRDFSNSDSATSPRVTIVSESFGRLLANGDDPTGHQITDIEVVGVVPDIITNVSRLSPLVMYMPVDQLSPRPNRLLVLRAASDPSLAIREATTAIRALDDSVTPQPMRTIDDQLGEQMSAQRFGMFVMGGLGTIAALLTAVGIYVLAESLARARRRELGIRAALGAAQWELGSIVLVETGRLVGLGILVGLGLAWIGASTIRAFLFQIEPLDTMTLAIVSALLLILALAVSLRAALSAMGVDVVQALREE